MQRLSSSALACSHCRYYIPEGWRGGRCQLLDVIVRGSWKACPLSIPFFTSVWSKPEGPIELEAAQIGQPIEVMPSQQLVTQYLAQHAPCTTSDREASRQNLLR